MDNQRILLWATLFFILWLMYQAWQEDYAQPDAPPPTPTQTTPDIAAPELPELPTGETAPPDAPPTAVEPDLAAARADGDIVTVVTDVLELSISTTGATLVEARLLEYPVHKDTPDVPVQLLSPDPAAHFVINTGLRAAGADAEPNHRVSYNTDDTRYVLADMDDELRVSFDWANGQGLAATKTFILKRGRYDIEVHLTVMNRTGAEWTGASYVQIQRRNVEHERSMFDVETFSFVGPVLYNGEKYDKLDVGDWAEQPLQANITGGWIAAIQHHFLAAAIPPPAEPFFYQGRLVNGSYFISEIGPPQTVSSGDSATFEQTLFVGPKLQSQLKPLAPGLELTVDYGWLTIIAKPLFWLLENVYSLVGNWGWAIIIVTILIKALFYKLTETQGRSMAKMRKLQPRLKHLQERYKDDRQELSKRMMDLYKREKVNPAAGCLPILVQIPVFLAFYWVLLESVELRHAPFMLWINDISSRDPYFILPVLMGAAMFMQFRLNPTPTADPVQAKVFMIMPLFMAALMAFFPAGLVLYWLTNTVLSIAQQWYINKKIDEEK